MKPFTTLLVTLAALTLQANGSGKFQLKIENWQNPNAKLLNGKCCGGNSSVPPCKEPCSTSFRLCLKQYQNPVRLTDKCRYGNVSSAVIGGNSFQMNSQVASARLTLPFTFSWTIYFSMVVDAWDNPIGKPAAKIMVVKYAGALNPSSRWKSLSYRRRTAIFAFAIRVVCDRYYYGKTCSKFCQPRNDSFGSYTCNQNGDRRCLAGWTGSFCTNAKCKTGCHKLHGSCNLPGECNCLLGWTGDLCDECVPAPGCLHGNCSTAHQCNCEHGWGGILCDRDLETCTRRDPCKNGGYCKNMGIDKYQCVYGTESFGICTLRAAGRG